MHVSLIGIHDVYDVPSFLRHTSDITPWYNAYRSSFHSCLRFQSDSLIDAPHALMICVSSSESNPLQMIDTLRSLRSLPTLFHNGVYDINLLRCVTTQNNN